jgi:hypothetical protein
MRLPLLIKFVIREMFPAEETGLFNKHKSRAASAQEESLMIERHLFAAATVCIVDLHCIR